MIGALRYAREIGAATVGLACNRDSELAEFADVMITPVVGPEVISGSTRMKAGLAQKMVLAALSTAVMVKLGKVRGNLMTHVTPVSSKLRARAVRIVMSLADVERRHILATLQSTGWNKSRTAGILGIERSTLDRKIRRYDLAGAAPKRRA